MHTTTKKKPMKNASKARRRQYQFLMETEEQYKGRKPVKPN